VLSVPVQVVVSEMTCNVSSTTLNPTHSVMHVAIASIHGDCRLKDDYMNAMDGIRIHLLRHSEPSKLAYVGSYSSFKQTTSVRNVMVR